MIWTDLGQGPCYEPCSACTFTSLCLHARSGSCKQGWGRALGSECSQDLCAGPNQPEGSQGTVPGEKGPAWGMVQGGRASSQRSAYK